MNDVHEPRLYKAFIALTGGGALLMFSLLFQDKTQDILSIFGWLFSVIGIIEGVMCNVAFILDKRTRHYMVQKEVIDSLAKADPDVRNAIGAWFPRYSFVYAGQPIICWQDTIVPLDVFREFMKESNPQYTAPLRDWKARGATYHRYWVLIYEKLVELELVIKDTASGSHSYMWSGRGYDRAWQMWLTSNISIPELD